MATPSDPWTDALEAYEVEARAGSRWRAPRVFNPDGATRFLIDSRSILQFSTNDYLALSVDPAVRSAASDAALRFGAGATASRLVSGARDIHIELEESLAQLKRTDAALVFPTGYQTAATVIPALCEPTDLIILDSEAHASLIDGAKLSGSSYVRFSHNDPDALDAVLAKRSKPGRRFFVAIESVYSMSGDIAPVDAIAAVCESRGAFLLVDEAHATGVFGPGGSGLCHSLNDVINPNHLLIMGTLSKALASQGGFVCGSRLVIDHLVQKARGFIYSTGLSPVCAAAALAAVDRLPLLNDEREHLQRIARRLRTKLSIADPSQDKILSPIIPYIIGQDAETVAIAGALFDSGFFAPAIRPPTVARGRAQLRFSVNAAHTEMDIDAVSDALILIQSKIRNSP
ncbi:MAG: 8-amino-7-oxononanoate synthase [Planctomycetota bacterium]